MYITTLLCQHGISGIRTPLDEERQALWVAFLWFIRVVLLDLGTDISFIYVFVFQQRCCRSGSWYHLLSNRDFPCISGDRYVPLVPQLYHACSALQRQDSGRSLRPTLASSARVTAAAVPASSEPIKTRGFDKDGSLP
jgi:hypothetical protein